MQLFVLINGEKFDVGQVGGGKLYFDKPVLLPAGHATLVIELDGQAKEKSIEIVAEPVATRIVQFK